MKLSKAPNRVEESTDKLWLEGEMPLENRASWFSLKCIEVHQLTGHLGVNTTGFSFFAECLRHSAKADIHSAKSAR